ncbi:MAG: DUF6612 family protein [Fusicatenibacter sp.]
MSRWKKAAAAFGILWLGVGMLTGCGKVTPRSLARDVVKNSENVKSADADMMVDFQGSIPFDTFLEGVSVDLTMKADLNLKCVQDPETAAAISGSCQISLMSSQYDLDIESYTVKEEEQYVTYLKMMDQWIKRSEPERQMKTDTVTQIDLFREIENGGITAELDEKMEKVNGKETYVMHLTADGEFLEWLFLASKETMGDASDIPDLQGTKAELDVYVYKDSHRLAKMEIDGAELGAALFNGEEQGEHVLVTSFRMAVTVNSYNEAETIRVPQEAVENAVESAGDGGTADFFGKISEEISGDTDDDGEDMSGEDSSETEEAIQNEDGSYTIQSDIGSLQATIVLPENFEYESSTSVYLSAVCYSEESLMGLQYCYDTTSTMEEMAEYYCDLGYLEGEESYTEIVSSGELTMEVNDLVIHYVAIQYNYLEEGVEYPCLECYAWTKPEELDSPFVIGFSYMGEKDPEQPPKMLVSQIYEGITLTKAIS